MNEDNGGGWVRRGGREAVAFARRRKIKEVVPHILSVLKTGNP